MVIDVPVVKHVSTPNTQSLCANNIAAMVQKGNPFIEIIGKQNKKMLKLIVDGKQDNDTSIMDVVTTRSLMFLPIKCALMRTPRSR